jgi:hypothetical protein
VDAKSLNEPEHSLRFHPLSEGDRERAFPCDERGVVDLDALSDLARVEYFFARTLIGRAFGLPTIC